MGKLMKNKKRTERKVRDRSRVKFKKAMVIRFDGKL